MDTPEKIPFFENTHMVKNEGLGGAENKVSSIAFNIPGNTDPKDVEYPYVLKEPRSVSYIESLAKKFPPVNDSERVAIQNFADYFDSREHFMNSGKDYKMMKEIFGDLLPDAQFILGEPRPGNESGFYVLQEKIKGKTWNEFSRGKSQAQNHDYMMQHRDQLINLIGGSRKVLIETGASVDIWGDNIMVDGKGNFVLIDPGSPSELERHFDDLLLLPKGMRTLIAKNVLQRGVSLENYPVALEMTSEEVSKTNEKFGFTREEFEDASKKLIVRCDILSQ